MRTFKKSELIDIAGWMLKNSDATAIVPLNFHILWVGGDDNCTCKDSDFANAGWSRIFGQQLIDRLTSIGYEVIDDTKEQPMKRHKFWMVWCPTRNPPKFRHDEEFAASIEAERLARENPEQEFFVLEATSRVIVGAVQHERLENPPLPF